MVDWESVRERYVSTEECMAEIARQYGISAYAVRYRAKKENWAALRRKAQSGDAASREERVTEKLLRRVEAAIDSSEAIDSKEIKTLTAALKELRELRKESEAASEKSAERIEVRFIGEAEELSR